MNFALSKTKFIVGIVGVLLIVVLLAVRLNWWASNNNSVMDSEAIQSKSKKNYIPKVSARSQLQDVSPGLNEPQVTLVNRNQLLQAAAGDELWFKSASQADSSQLLNARVNSSEVRGNATVLKGEVVGGGVMVATIGPGSVNIFLQTAVQVLRFAGKDFVGVLTPTRRSNLTDDIRVRPSRSLERLALGVDEPKPERRGDDGN